MGRDGQRFILLPLFEGSIPMEALIASFTGLIPFIRTKLTPVLRGKAR